MRLNNVVYYRASANIKAKNLKIRISRRSTTKVIKDIRGIREKKFRAGTNLKNF